MNTGDRNPVDSSKSQRVSLDSDIHILSEALCRGSRGAELPYIFAEASTFCTLKQKKKNLYFSQSIKMTDTDAFKFTHFKIFDSIKECLPEGAREICDVYEDLVFVWNFKENNLFVVNWRTAQSKDVENLKHQVRKECQ